jgi:hypothetical protein
MGDVETEVAEPEEIEGGESGTLLTLKGDEQLIAMENIAKNAERMILAKQKVWNVLLKLAKPGDWTVFESQGKKKAEIGHGGAMRYAAFLGISFTNWTSEKVTGTDEKGQWFRWDFECDCLFGGRAIRVYGRAGSRDRFFGKDHGQFKELHEINEGDIKIAARRSAMKEGVKTMLGLHHIPPDELEAAGVKMEYAGGHAFKSKEERAEGAQSVTVALDSAILKKEGETNGKKWKWFVLKDAEGVDYSTFSETVYNAAKSAIEGKKSVVISFEPNTKGGRTVTALSAA